MFNVDLLTSLVAVAETASFTQAAARTNQTQSAVSQQIRRLEKQLGCTLLERTTHQVGLTEAGKKLLAYAHTILNAVEDAEFVMSQPELSGSVRLGLAEDFATTRLPEVLGRFRRAHPAVRMQVETGLSGLLFERLDRGEFDLVFAKRLRSSSRGKVLLRSPLVWLVAPKADDLVTQRPLPLALHPAPSVTRALVLRALKGAAIKHVEIFNSPSIPGVRGGAVAGLGITAFGKHFVPPGLQPLTAEKGNKLPPLPDLEYSLEQRAHSSNRAAEALAAVLEAQLEMQRF